LIYLKSLVTQIMKWMNEMAERSYAQIRWQQEQFGLLMVNASNEKFFVRADKLQRMCEEVGQPLVLKLRDRKPSKAIGYYPGQVIGVIERENSSVVIKLYISEPYNDVIFKDPPDDKIPESYHVAQVFAIPEAEFESFMETIYTMLEQAVDFNKHLRAAEMKPLKQHKRGIVLE